MPVATVTSKGQITLPAAIRRRLRLRQGSKVEFRTDERGQVFLATQPVALDDIAGCLRRPGQPTVAAETMRAQAGAAIAQSHRR